MTEINTDFVRHYLANTAVVTSELSEISPNILRAFSKRGIDHVSDIFQHRWEELADMVEERDLLMMLNTSYGLITFTKVEALRRVVIMSLSMRIGNKIVRELKIADGQFFKPQATGAGS